jgi:CheY-like chemotaxis protein
VFPVLEFAAATEPQPDTAGGSQIPAFENTLRVLIVEDNRINQRVVRGQLDLLGLRYELASNGLDAVAKVTDNKYSVILMDCHMPEMDGWEAARRIRALPNGRNIPIIAMTASATPEDRHAATEAGMDGFLAKPFTRAELESTLSHYIPAVHNAARNIFVS